jgi:hypothetical protein
MAGTDSSNRPQVEIFDLSEKLSLRSKPFDEFQLSRDLSKLNGNLVLLKEVEQARWL